MKKIFTLIAMALVAMSVNAKQDVGFSSKVPYGAPYAFGGWEWIGLVLAEGEPVKNEEAKTADDSNVKYFDASAFDYLCVKYKAADVAFQVILQYKCAGTIGQWGVEFNQATVDIKANTNGFVAIKLDASQKNTVNQVAIQSKGSGNITLEEFYWASEAEYTADAAANPETPYVAPTKDLDLANATGGWGGKTYDANTHVATITESNAASGWWVDGDYSNYDYFVMEVVDLQKVGYGQFVLYNTNFEIPDGSFVKVCDISQLDRTKGTNCVIQGGAGTTWTWKRAYFATAEYIQQNGIKDEKIYGDTQDLTLADLNAGWNATYDAQTKTITIDETAEDGGGKGWWFGTGADAADFSHFDNVVIEFEPTTIDGTVMVEYSPAAAPASNRAEEVEPGVFGVGATCVVVPLDPAQKSTVKSIQIAGAMGAKYTLKNAFVAIASATPEANIGTITGISTVNAALQQNGVRYNLAGQKVDASYKGVVIENGKKMMVK